MKYLILLSIVLMFSCTEKTGLNVARQNQIDSVKANKKQAKGLRNASRIVNKELSDANK